MNVAYLPLSPLPLLRDHEAHTWSLPCSVPSQPTLACAKRQEASYSAPPSSDTKHRRSLRPSPGPDSIQKTSSAFTRFKATSESDTSLPPNGGQRRRRAASPAQTSSKKRRTDAPASSGSENPASLKDNAPTGGVGDESSRSKTSRAGNSVLPRSSSSSSSKSATHGATAAMEVAAHEIARSATPSALSWALLSLLADGGVRAESGADGFAGTRRRGQGHLLPRSRDKYPTPVRSGGRGGG